MDYIKIGNLKFSRGVLFILPGILFFGIMVIYPAGYVIYLSLFTEGKGLGLEPQFIGLKNYTTVFSSRNFFKILSNTLMYSFFATAFHIIIGLFMAVLLNNKVLKRRTLTIGRSLFLIPWAISPSVVAIMFQVMLHPKVGPVGIILRTFNPKIAFNPLGSPSLSLLTVTLTNIWKFTPFYFLILLAGLQAIDDGLYEAARMDVDYDKGRSSQFFGGTVNLSLQDFFPELPVRGRFGCRGADFPNIHHFYHDGNENDE